MLDFQMSTPGFSSKLAVLQLGADPNNHARLKNYPLFNYFLKLFLLFQGGGGSALLLKACQQTCYAEITAYSLISAVLLFPWPSMPAGLYPALSPASYLDH